MTQDLSSQHSVIVHFYYGIEELEPLHELEDKLSQVISDQNAGLYDGHEVSMDSIDSFLYMYGPNAETLFKSVLPILRVTDFMKGAIAYLTFGPMEESTKVLEVKIE